MAVNAAGYQPVLDAGAPATLGGYAREVISGGQFVFLSGAADAVSSGINSFDPKTDCLFAAGASGAVFNGIATMSAGSNEPITAATNGTFIVRAENTVTMGKLVSTGGAHGVLDITSTSQEQAIGRAMTSATSGNYAVVQIGKL